MLFVDGDGELC